MITHKTTIMNTAPTAPTSRSSDLEGPPSPSPSAAAKSGAEILNVKAAQIDGTHARGAEGKDRKETFMA